MSGWSTRAYDSAIKKDVCAFPSAAANRWRGFFSRFHRSVASWRMAAMAMTAPLVLSNTTLNSMMQPLLWTHCCRTSGASREAMCNAIDITVRSTPWRLECQTKRAANPCTMRNCGFHDFHDDCRVSINVDRQSPTIASPRIGSSDLDGTEPAQNACFRHSSDLARWLHLPQVFERTTATPRIPRVSATQSDPGSY